MAVGRDMQTPSIQLEANRPDVFGRAQIAIVVTAISTTAAAAVMNAVPQARPAKRYSILR